MARRSRTRTRARRAPEAARRAPAPVRGERDDFAGARPAAHRPSRGGRTGYARAAGAPSATLERAALLERSFIQKDFRRLGIVVGVSLVVLVVAGFLESALVR